MTVYVAGTPVVGEVAKIMVEDPGTPGTFVEVTNMNTFDKSTDRPVRKEKVFNKTQPLRSPSTVRDQTISFGGLMSIGDSGQGILNAAEAAGTEVNLKFLLDGTNGFTQKGYVHSYKLGAKPDGSYEDVTYDVECSADPVVVGAGFTLL